MTDNPPETVTDTAAVGELDVAHLRVAEALVFAAAGPVDAKRIAAALPEDADVKAIMQALQARHAEGGFNLVKVGKSWSFRTAPDLGDLLVHEREQKRRLSRAAVESLAVIAYHQPITRAEIEEVRGVTQSKGTLDVLMEAGWIKPGRRRETPGRPVTWVTTPTFLEHFDLESLRDLPGVRELKASGFLDSRPAIQAFRPEDVEQPPTAAAAAREDDADADPDDAAERHAEDAAA